MGSQYVKDQLHRAYNSSYKPSTLANEGEIHSPIDNLPHTYYHNKITLALPNLFPLSETINGSTRTSYEMSNTLGDTLKSDNYN